MSHTDANGCTIECLVWIPRYTRPVNGGERGTKTDWYEMWFKAVIGVTDVKGAAGGLVEVVKGAPGPLLCKGCQVGENGGWDGGALVGEVDKTPSSP